MNKPSIDVQASCLCTNLSDVQVFVYVQTSYRRIGLLLRYKPLIDVQAFVNVQTSYRFTDLLFMNEPLDTTYKLHAVDRNIHEDDNFNLEHLAQE